MAAWAIAVLGLVLIVSEGSVAHVLGLDASSLQWSLVVTAYVGLRRDVNTSMMLFLLWIFPMDWFSGAPAGLHAFGLMAMFWSLRVLATRFERQWNLAKVLLAGLGAGVYHLATAMVFVVTAPDSPVLDAILFTMPAAVMVTALWSVPLGWLLGKIEQVLHGRQHNDGLLWS